MGKILFITNRNIINTCGELRLIKNRAQTLYNTYDMVTDFIAFTHKDRVRPEEINAGGTVEVVKYNLKNWFDIVIKYKALKRVIARKLEGEEYSVVILSAPIVLPLVDYIKYLRPDMVVGADVHGAYEELIEFQSNKVTKDIFRKIIFKKLKKLEYINLPKFDFVLAVSEALKDYLNEEYSVVKERVHIVPCSNHSAIIEKDKLIEKRENSRKKYGINADDILFIYSGGVSKWQCIDETVVLFEKICDKLRDKRCKLLLLSGEIEAIKQYENENIIVDSLAATEVENVLPAADYAFLIRENCVTNRVAFPNKFLEYISAGLFVITTPYVLDVAHMVKENDFGYVLSSSEFEEGLVKFLLAERVAFADVDVRERLLADVGFENRLKFFCEMRGN